MWHRERKSVRERKRERRERGEKEAGRELGGRVGFNQTRPYQRSRPSIFDLLLLPFYFIFLRPFLLLSETLATCCCSDTGDRRQRELEGTLCCFYFSNFCAFQWLWVISGLLTFWVLGSDFDSVPHWFHIWFGFCCVGSGFIVGKIGVCGKWGWAERKCLG